MTEPGSVTDECGRDVSQQSFSRSIGRLSTTTTKSALENLDSFLSQVFSLVRWPSSAAAALTEAPQLAPCTQRCAVAVADSLRESVDADGDWIGTRPINGRAGGVGFGLDSIGGGEYGSQ